MNTQSARGFGAALPENLYVARPGNRSFISGQSAGPFFPMNMMQMLLAVGAPIAGSAFCMYASFLSIQLHAPGGSAQSVSSPGNLAPLLSTTPVWVVLGLTVLVILGSVWLARKFVVQMQTRSRLQSEGQLLLGKITEAHLEQRRNQQKNVVLDTYGSYTIVVGKYEFQSPTGMTLGGSLYGDAKNIDTAPGAGTPVAVLYCDDKLFMYL